MRKLTALLALLATAVALTGCSQDPETTNPNNRDGATMTNNENETVEPTCVSHDPEPVYDHENSIAVIMNYFEQIHEDLSQEARRDHAEYVLSMMVGFGQMNGIARIEGEEPRRLASRRFMLESETGQICRMVVRGPGFWEIDSISDPVTGRLIFGIVE